MNYFGVAVSSRRRGQMDKGLGARHPADSWEDVYETTDNGVGKNS